MDLRKKSSGDCDCLKDVVNSRSLVNFTRPGSWGFEYVGDWHARFGACGALRLSLSS